MMALCSWNSLALLTRHWPAVVDQDGLALLLHSGCAGSVGNISTLEGWLILIFLGDIAAALFSDGGAVFVSHILAVLLGLLGAHFIHNGFTFSILDGVADLRGHVLAIILSLLFTDLSRCSLTLVNMCCSTHFFRNILALLFWDLGAFLVSHGVADLRHVVHHSPLLGVTLLHSGTLGLVVGVALLGWDGGLRGVVTLLHHGVGTDILGDGVALGSVADVGAVEDVNQEQGEDEKLHHRL